MGRFYFFLLFLSASSTKLFAQTLVSGKVISSEDKTEVPGVNIIVKGTNTGTVTDVNGYYSIAIPSSDAVLIFSFVGLATQEILVGNVSTLDVIMQPDASQLDEVVVTGYQIENRRNLPGSISIVRSDKIQNSPIASFDQILQGRVPGMLVTGGSGQPGSSANVIIRGVKSLSGSNSPLYILDGVPIAGGIFNTLNPNDFESISVLKDATAAALYGSRGANGVVVITSKRGKAGETKVNYNVQYGISYAPQNRLQVMNTNQKIDFELLTGGSELATYSAEKIARLRLINTNWQDVLFTSARTIQHDLSVQGGNDKTTFFLSGNYTDQEGTVRNTGLKRYTAKFNLQHEAGTFRTGLNATLGYSKTQQTLEGNSYIGSPLNAVRWSNPYEAPYDPTTGDYTKIRSGQPNALQELLENHQRFNDVKAVFNVYAEYFIPKIEGLSVKTSWGTDYTQRDGDTYFDRSTYTGTQTPGQSGSQARANSYNVSFIGTTSVNYHTAFGTDHELSGSAYHELIYNQVKGFNYTGYGIQGNLRNDGGITVSNTYLPSLSGTNTESALQSFFGEASYGYKKKYFAKLGARNDQSSRFGADKRNAFFYSGGLNWRISDEEFFKNFTSKVDFLKIYANFGTAGNQSGIGDFGSLSLYSLGASYDGSAGIVQSQPTNPSLGWETVQSFNAGIEYSVLRNRISGTVEFYSNSTINMLLPTQLSRTSGFSSITQNVGEMSNRGVELDINVEVLKINAFSWNVNANFTYNKNEIVKLVDGNEIVNGLTITKEGYPAGTNYVVPYAGVNSANGDALYVKKDGSLTNQFSSDDLVPYGTRYAPRFGGFTNSFSYKGIDLSIFFSWVQGNKVYNNDRTNVENPTYYVDNLAVSLLRAWKQPGDITDVPRIQTTSGLTSDSFQPQTSRFIEDGSFLRLRNVMLSYNLPPKWMQKAKLKNVRIYVQGQNLVTFFKFQGWDPELAAGTLVGAQYPALRTVMAGINIGL